MWKQPRAGGGRTPANPADNPSTVGVLGNGTLGKGKAAVSAVTLFCDSGGVLGAWACWVAPC